MRCYAWTRTKIRSKCLAPIRFVMCRVARALGMRVPFLVWCARCTLIVLAERKEVGGAATYDNNLGVTLVTAANRRNPPQCLDSAIHHNNLLNNILVGE